MTSYKSQLAPSAPNYTKNRRKAPHASTLHADGLQVCEITRKLHEKQWFRFPKFAFRTLDGFRGINACLERAEVPVLRPKNSQSSAREHVTQKAENLASAIAFFSPHVTFTNDLTVRRFACGVHCAFQTKESLQLHLQSQTECFFQFRTFFQKSLLRELLGKSDWISFLVLQNKHF